MALYFLDVMCAKNIFVGMNLRWHVAELPVHVYFSVLWENRYKNSYSLICDQFIVRIYFILFKKECLRLSAMSTEVFGATNAPHLLPAHVLDGLVVGEICYQTILQGYNATLVKDKKRVFIPYGFHVGIYLVKDTSQAK
jgi:hypothetical protein